MSNKRKPKGSNVWILTARATEVKPGSVNIATIRHDDWCGVFTAGLSMLHCDCHPEISFEEIG